MSINADMLAIFALCVSMFALWHSNRMQRHSRTQESAATSLSGFASLEQMIKDYPGALRFHGITDEELAVAGITAAEMGYFLSNITTGGIYYRTTDVKGLIQFFNDNGYYGEMFKQEDSRNAWAICRCCLAPSEYRNKLDELSEQNGGAAPALIAYRKENSRH